MHLHFGNGYKTGIVTSFSLLENEKTILNIEEYNINIKFFLRTDASGEILHKSEDVFVPHLNRLLKLKTFI